MRIHKHVKLATIIILAFSMVNIPGLVGFQRGLGVAQGVANPLYPVTVTLSTGEKVFIASHIGDLASGNWIQLSGGTSIKLPSLTLAYEGLDSASYTPDGVTVTIESSFAAGEATYPLTTHQIYSAGQSITAKFWGATDLPVDPVDFKLLKLTSITEARTSLTEAFRGDLSRLRSKLNNPTWSETSGLDGAGDATVTIPAQSVGNYLLVVVKENASPYELYIYSATIIEVVSQTLYVTCPSSVERGDPLNINTGLTGLTYIQGAILIKETAYSGEIKLVTEGTVLSTEIYLNEVLMADGTFASASVSYETALLLLNQLGTAFGPNQMTIGINLISGSLSLSTSSLNTGAYVLLVGVYDLSGSIVGVYQKTVTVTTPSAPPSIKNKLPIADAGPDQKAWVNRTINFDGTKSTDPDGYIVDWGWNWNFGDGETATGKTASHTYTEPGSYTVTLTVKDNRYGEDTDTCTVTISEPPQPVTDELAELVPGNQTDHIVDAMEETNTTVTLNTTDPVTVTIIKYEDNPHPEDPLPATALPHYVDVQVSNPDAISWPIYVEMHYTDEEIMELNESSLGIYYWMNGTWQRCSNTGVDTQNNIVWAYMTREEASGSPILIAGVHAIITPPLPPFIDNLTITPAVIELGENVTISIDIMNPNDGAISYGFEMQIGELTLLVDVELEAYESKTGSRTIFPTAIGTYNVTVIGMTGNFTVKTPPLPAKFVVSDLTITPEEPEIWEEIEISFTVTNIGEETGNYKFSLLIEGPFAAGSVEMVGILGAGESETATYKLTPETPGDYTFTVDGLIEILTVTAPPKPAEFEASNLVVTPQEVEPGVNVMVSATITNIGEETGTHIVELKQDGEVVDSESITLNGGESTTVTLTTSSETEGSHSIEMDGLSGSYTVKAPPKKPPTIWIILIGASVIILIYLIWTKTDWIDQIRAARE